MPGLGIYLLGVLSLGLCVVVTSPGQGARAASPTSFDGTWSAVLDCAGSDDGAKGYRWKFPVKITNGRVRGQHNLVGQPESGTLSGVLPSSGVGTLKMAGLTGNPAQNLGGVRGGLPYSYTVSAMFSATSGSGKRQELRNCTIAFSRG